MGHASGFCMLNTKICVNHVKHTQNAIHTSACLSEIKEKVTKTYKF